MKLYTLISIALSVFGATYSALAALRTHFEALIKLAKGEAETHFLKISEHYGNDNKITERARKRKGRIGTSGKVWNWCNTVPAIIFAFFAFFIAIWVIFNWEMLCNQKEGDPIDHTIFPWTWFRSGLIWMVAVDLLCFLSAALAWWACSSISSALREQYDTVLEEEKKGITPA